MVKSGAFCNTDAPVVSRACSSLATSIMDFSSRKEEVVQNSSKLIDEVLTSNAHSVACEVYWNAIRFYVGTVPSSGSKDASVMAIQKRI